MIDVRDLVGIPFKTHGRGKDGMDCYGVAIEVLRRNDIDLPDVFYDKTDGVSNEKTAELIKEGLPLERIEKPEELCLVDISVTGNSTSHVGVYVGQGYFIHATRNLGVCMQKLSRYENRIKAYYRVKK